MTAWSRSFEPALSQSADFSQTAQALEDLKKQLSTREIATLDRTWTDPQVVGEDSPKVVWYVSDKQYVVTSLETKESFFGWQENSCSLENIIYKATYYFWRNQLFTQMLSPPLTSRQSHILQIDENCCLFIHCILSKHDVNLGISKEEPRSLSFTSSAAKILLQNITDEELSTKAESLTYLLNTSSCVGRAALFLDDKNALICKINEDTSFSLTKSRVHLCSANTGALPTFLNLLSLTSLTSPALQAFSLKGRIFLAVGRVNPDQSFFLSDEEIFLSFPRTLQQEELSSLKEIIKKLWKTPPKKRWNNTSAMAELIATAQELGRASLRVSHHEQLLHIVVTKQQERTFLVELAPWSLSDRELSLFEVEKAIEPSLLNKNFFSLYKDALEKLSIHSGKKITITHDLSGTQRIQLALDHGLVTFGIDTFLGEGTFKKAARVLRLDIHEKMYAKCIPAAPGKRKKLLAEATSMQQLHNQYVVKFRKFSQKSFSLQMEYCNRGTAKIFQDQPPKAAHEVALRLTVLYHAALGLAYIHSLPGKLAHMDFKPGNLFLTEEEGQLVGKVGDLCPRKDSERAAATIQYLDIEAIISFPHRKFIASSQACDVWALGLTLFECMYGKAASPFPQLFTNTINPSLNNTSPDIQIQLMNLFDLGLSSLHFKLNDPNPLVGRKVPNLLRQMLTLSRQPRTALTDDFLQEFHSALS